MDEGKADESSSKARLELELEFVQALANPLYLQHIASQAYFADPAFVNYLAYLKEHYCRPERARFVQYPQALQLLELLQKKEFRERIATETISRDVAMQQLAHWTSSSEL
ncbi:uncharacterized protein L969DRAFT_50770 [Mixia osmundae IAM 14324]|uniref:Mediator of RNA polymerase II transcription subunit 31 n=1 Tax=Mixia osmundae (strain CBS 9802 / IAM 14324 / JCM 22182 / KY 12970) TaxID=764103 RepID=G7E0E5_MIXOS|nr:uncharacterized protein L969DRAFT_50770 [Mixia osmundae IAM 14324]KEI38314.1 hypothetical protein L969DRAFT_50770 [Mixia osmundae IAM 14324]GAA96305.1 hypothetical protein E5Q_02971 [Mixia osmundae IAM 14324]